MTVEEARAKLAEMSLSEISGILDSLNVPVISASSLPPGKPEIVARMEMLARSIDVKADSERWVKRMKLCEERLRRIGEIAAGRDD